MIEISAAWKKKTTKASKALLAVGALAGAILAIKELGEIFFSSEPDAYDEDWIPLVYADAGNFRAFLERNDGKMAKINSAIALDFVLPVNSLVHQACEMDLPEHDENDKAKTFYSIGLPTFSKDFDETELDSATYNESTGDLAFPSHVLEKIKCLDTLRIELIDPKSFRWSYGGTGTQSLPLSGTFKFTSRAFSGPRIEYTLRQVAE
mgnify:FL=1